MVAPIPVAGGPTFNPLRAVTHPTESTLVVSSDIRVPPTVTFPVNVAATPVIPLGKSAAPNPVPLKSVAEHTQVTITPYGSVGLEAPVLSV